MTTEHKPHYGRDELMAELRAIAALEPRAVPFGDVQEIMRERARLHHRADAAEKQLEVPEAERQLLIAEKAQHVEMVRQEVTRAKKVEEQLAGERRTRKTILRRERAKTSELAQLKELHKYEQERADREKARADNLLGGYVETQEQAAGLLEEVQVLERENDNLTERLDKRIDEDSVFRVYDDQVEENQRLKADISGLCKREEAALTRARLAERRVQVLREQLRNTRKALEEITRIKPDTRPMHPGDNYKRARKAIEIARNALESNPEEER